MNIISFKCVFTQLRLDRYMSLSRLPACRSIIQALWGSVMRGWYLRLFLFLFVVCGLTFGLFGSQTRPLPLGDVNGQQKQIDSEPNGFSFGEVYSKAQVLSNLKSSILRYQSKHFYSEQDTADARNSMHRRLPEKASAIAAGLPSYKQDAAGSRKIIIKVKESLPVQAMDQKFSGSVGQHGGAFEKINRHHPVKKIKKVFSDGHFNGVRQSMKSPQQAMSRRNAHGLDRLYSMEVEMDQGETLQEFLKYCNQLPEVEYAEEDYPVKAQVFPNDPYFPAQWYLHNTGQDYPASGNYNVPPGLTDADIDAPEAWDFISDCNTVIAVVDTGVDYMHPDLAGNVWVNLVEFNGVAGVDDDLNGYVDDVYGYNVIGQNGDPRDDNGHGTHCAGIIAARGNNGRDISGVCWSAKIMALKFLDENGSGSSLDSVEAIVYAVDNGAKVISNSYGGADDSLAVQEAIQYATENGVIFVAAAGNDGDNSPQYPAANEGVIAVAATDSMDRKASFSSFGDWVDLAAPGVDILSLRAAGTALGIVYDDTTTILSGTSMACPVVSGACGLLLGVNPTLTSREIHDVLCSTLDPIADVVAFNNGRLNVARALSALYGKIQFEDKRHSCSSQIGLWLSDIHTAGQNGVSVTVQTDLGDTESVILHETGSVAGFFRGTITADSGPVGVHDGVLQLSDGETITVSYSNQADIYGQPEILTDKAIIDCRGPALSALDVVAPGSIVTIRFLTDEPARTVLRFGFGCDDQLPVLIQQDELLTEHVIEIKNLLQETTYSFVLETSDALGNKSIHDNDGSCYSFTTSSVLGNLYVPGDFATIQAAIDRAWNQDTIWVADGIYTGPGNYDIDFLGLAITVRSEHGPDRCIIDCQMKGRGFFFHNGESSTSILDGFTIKHGYPAADVSPTINFDAWLGGGIYCKDSCPTITNCKITDNFSPYWGGGICIVNSSAAQPVRIDNCTLSRNHASLWGGGILSEGNVVLTQSTLTDNAAGTGGGGIDCGGQITIDSCTIANNFVYKLAANSGYGGGVFSSGSFEMINSVIRGNTGYYGGGLFYFDNHSVITNCIFSGNWAIYGGGISYYSNEFILTNCTLTKNSAAYSGGALGYYESGTKTNAVLENCILWNNQAGADGNEIYFPAPNSQLTISHSDIQGGDSGIIMLDNSALDWDNNNINVDPNFTFEYDFHLMSHSPCINRGTNTPVGGLAEKDVEGNSRLSGGIVDMGAYEFENETAGIAVSPQTFEFHCIQAGTDPVGQSLSIRNCGGGLLSWQIEEDSPWLEVSHLSGTSAGEINLIELRVHSAQLAAGNYECLLTIYDPAAVNNPRTISVRLHVSGILYVPSQYPTIQSAIHTAWNGDVVLVADGVYAGNGNRDIELYGKAVTIKSESGPDYCVIDCEGTDVSPHRGVSFLEDSNSILDGFTITGGYVNGDYYAIFPPSQGGGIYSQDSSSTIRNCKIKNNFCSSGLFPSQGGGIMLEGTSSYDNVLIRNCIIRNNHVDGAGGGLSAIAPFSLESSIITQNNGDLAGGGIYYLPYYSHGKITRCLLTENTSKTGGGIYIDGGISGNGTEESLGVTDTILRNNTAAQGSQFTMAKLFVDLFSQAGISYSDINSDPNDIYVEDGFSLHWGPGIIDKDPLFVDGANDDYRLQTGSPAIEAGQDFPLGDGSESTDFSGQVCPIDGNYDGLAVNDMGPYEFLPEPSLHPIIAISAWEYNFRAYQDDVNPADQILSLSNSGAGTLNWSIQSDCDWIHVIPSSGTAGSEKQDVTITIDSSGLARGRYLCELSILDGAAVNSPRTFKVNLQIFIKGQWYVPSEFGTLQAAIDASSDGDIIFVSPGLYTENINMQGKNITLTSIDPNDPAIVAETVIQGAGVNPVVTFMGNETACRIAGFTITGGQSPGDGGGIQGNQARADILNCAIRGNTAQGQGGGIHGIRGSILNCIVEANTADLGGGIADCAEVSHSVISRNESQEGGGLYRINGNIANCTIESNTALDGGGISQCSGQVEDCGIFGNIARQQGGGLYGVSGPVIRSRIEGNQAVLGGGAADCNDVFNSVISQNQSDEGGGFYRVNGNAAHCTIVSNTGLKGAGLSQCLGWIENCIIWDNNPDSLYQSSRPYFSCIQGDGRGEGNMEVDPEFVDLQAGDYRLKPGSFCIDAGNPDPNVILDTDIESRPRSLDGNNDGSVIPDMGAYEMPLSDQPVIGVSAPNFTFSTLGSNTQILKIWSAGQAPVHYTIDTQDCPWLDVVPISGVVGGTPQDISLVVDADDIEGGLYQCELIISDPAAFNTPRIITIVLKVLKDEIYLTPQGSSIQHAVNYLMEGGTLILADGVYTGPGNRDIDFGGLSATIRSEHGPENCIIDPNGSEMTPYRAFLFQNNEDPNTILKGLTISNGYGRESGGAIYCDQASPTIINCVFRNNRSPDNLGGAVYVRAGTLQITGCTFESNRARLGGGLASLSGSLRLNNTVFLSNSARSGGAIYSQTGTVNAESCLFTTNAAQDGGGCYHTNSQGQLTDCTFTGNYTTLESWNHGGGGMFNYRSQLTLSGCRFSDNRGAWEGGAILNSQSSPLIEECTFVGNQSLGNDGGALFNLSQSNPTILRCTFHFNAAGSWGGAMRNQQSSPRVENSLFIANSAVDNGGAIFNYLESSPAVTNCTFVDNDANGNEGGAIYSLTRCQAEVNSSIFWENQPPQVADDSTSTARISYSSILWLGVGNINISSPLFIDPENDDYHLLPDSLCIDAGDPNLPYDNEPWPNGGRINMGAYGNTSQAARSRDGLVPLGFTTVRKTRLGRTLFAYELAVSVYNSNLYDVTSVRLQLKDWDAAVLSTSDDLVTIDTIPAQTTMVSSDTFQIVVDRSLLIETGRLTWELAYYVPVYEQQVQQAMMSMLLSDIDAGIPGDISGDGKVNFEDFAILAGQWDAAPGNPSADIAPPPNGRVWIEDLMYLAENWMN